MAVTSVPAIDANICSGWTEQQINLYNSLPFYFVKKQVKEKEFYPSWGKLVGSIPWQANMGPTMRLVRNVPSPHMRQFAFPTEILGGNLPKKDVLDIREVTVDASIYRHRFVTPNMSFIPNFKDFMKDHIQPHRVDITEKQLRYNDVYIRGRIFHESPYIFLPNRAAGELIGAPIGVGDDVNKGNGFQGSATAKSTGFLQGVFAEIGSPGNLSFNAINLCLTIMENDLRIPAYNGSDMPKDDQGLSSKYCLVCSGEAWNQFLYDPWMNENKPIDMDIVHNGWKGSFFGRIVSKIEDLPIRISADGTFPTPQLREVAPDAYNIGESVNNPAYNQAPYEVAFLCGAQGYDAIEVGPPPSAFTGSGLPDGFGKMTWNGEIILSKNLLLECIDENGQLKYDTNEFGEYLRIISQVTYGFVPRQ